MPKRPDNEKIWKTVAKALGAELREHAQIQGISGLEHPVQAIAVDDKNKRVLIVSAEPNPRIAALMQVDIQATMPDVRVLVARPVLFDVPQLTRGIFTAVGTGSLDPSSLLESFKALAQTPESATHLKDTFLEPVLEPLFKRAGTLQLSGASQIMGIVQQVANIDWDTHLQGNPFEDPSQIIAAFLAEISTDSTEADRNHGICPIPLYEFTPEDWEMLLGGRRIAETRERLKELGIYQYFFPAPDHLLLGLADRGVSNSNSLVKAVEQAPLVGHPIGATEIVPKFSDVPQLLEQLKDIGYVAEADVELTITDAGQELRQSIRMRPREGVIQKLSRIANIKINLDTSNLKNLFKAN